MLLAAEGIAADAAAFALCRDDGRHAGNNRVVRIDLPDRRLIAKSYYRSADDPRDRLGAEWSLLSYAQRLGLAATPKPLACDKEAGIALYEFIEGRRVQPRDVKPEMIEKAIAFFLALNPAERTDAAALLPVAAEACFSIADHLTLIDRRVARLDAIQETDDVDRRAVKFVGRLRETWAAIRRRIETAADRMRGGLTALLHQGQRCVSPSDFGFHNALLRPQGDICFIDFEYAGWDDPAKMISDFFCQPEVPVAMSYFARFLEATASIAPHPDDLRARARALLPAYRVKWSCIMLNPFLREPAKRRQFANPAMDILGHKHAQLAKAERALLDIGN